MNFKSEVVSSFKILKMHNHALYVSTNPILFSPVESLVEGYDSQTTEKQQEITCYFLSLFVVKLLFFVLYTVVIFFGRDLIKLMIKWLNENNCPQKTVFSQFFKNECSFTYPRKNRMDH